MTPSRPAARIILLDPEGRILMQKEESPDGRAVWHLPGGGLEPGEDFESTASRKAYEATGIPVPLGPCVWVREHPLRYERYYVARSQASEGRLRDQRWWTEEEIRNTGDLFAPSRLPELLPGILRGHYPYRPIETGA